MTRRTGTGVVGVLCLLAALLLPSVLQAADFPNKPINLMVPYAAGGSTDLVARALAKVSAKLLPQPLVLVNQPGGAGSRAACPWSRPPPTATRCSSVTAPARIW